MNRNLLFPLQFIAFLWFIKFIENIFGINFTTYGIYPREVSALKGILFAPLIHANFQHLISNTIPLLILGLALFGFYPKVASRVFITCHLLTGLLVWLFAFQYSYHIGASGLVYGLAFFLMTLGIFQRDFKSLAISIVVVAIYGGLVWGVLPTQPGVSWESHLSGGIVGVTCAYFLGKSAINNGQ